MQGQQRQNYQVYEVKQPPAKRINKIVLGVKTYLRMLFNHETVMPQVIRITIAAILLCLVHFWHVVDEFENMKVVVVMALCFAIVWQVFKSSFYSILLPIVAVGFGLFGLFLEQSPNTTVPIPHPFFVYCFIVGAVTTACGLVSIQIGAE